MYMKFKSNKPTQDVFIRVTQISLSRTACPYK